MRTWFFSDILAPTKGLKCPVSVQYVDQVECSVIEMNRVTLGNVFIV